MTARRPIQYPATAGSVALDALLRTGKFSLARAGRALGVSAVTVYHWRIGAKSPTGDHRETIREFSAFHSLGLEPILASAWDDYLEPAARAA